MMPHYWLTFTLKSDATFGSGDGVAGLIDREIEHDALGLPFLRGRTLKGLLREEADNLLFALGVPEAAPVPDSLQRWVTARNKLFGTGGSTGEVRGVLHFGRAQLPAQIREAVRQALKPDPDGEDKPKLSTQQVLASLTGVRRQTAVDAGGVPADGSLRAMRVILRETLFQARLDCAGDLDADQKALLSASVLAFRRAGTGRNRGRGKLAAELYDAEGESILRSGYDLFIKEALS